MLTYFLSLLSKETSITFIVLLPLTLHFFSPVSPRKNIFITLLFVVTALIYLGIRRSVLHGTLADDTVSIADNVLVGAKTFSTHIGTAFYIIGLYVKLLFFPHPLSYDYSFNQIPIVSLENIFSIGAMLFYTAIGIYASMILVKSFKNRKNGIPSTRDILPSFRILSFGIFFFLVTIFLFSNLVLTIGTSMGDRLMYFPSLGFCICMALLYIKFFMKENRKLEIRNWKLYPLIFILILYSYKTYSRNAYWKNNYTLYSHDVHVVPNSTKAHYYLGLELVKVIAATEPDSAKRRKIYEKGINELEKAVKILPSFASAYTQMGVAYYRMKNYEKAIENYNKAATLRPSDAITLNNIGTVYFEWGKYREAAEKFQQALQVDPRYVDGYMNLGSVYGTLQQYDKAIDAFLNAIKYAPDNALAYHFLAITYQNKGDRVNAEKYFEMERKFTSSSSP
jgi:tetratricopeptide (TPR) repeat protein